MLGLNDRHIAKRNIEQIQLPLQEVPGHLKGDGAYVLSRVPDFIILGPAEGTTTADPWFLSDLELARDSRFLRDYRVCQVRLDGRGAVIPRGRVVFTYYQRIAPVPAGTRREAMPL